MPEIIKPEIVLSESPQICGSAQAESVKYHLYTGKSGSRWLVGDVPDPGNYVYLEGAPGSKGFGGRTLTFSMVDGTELCLTGPWHSNPDYLFQDTGVDVRGTIPAQYVIAMNHRWEGRYGETLIMSRVLFEDDQPYSCKERAELGMEHPEIMAKRFATELGYSVQLNYRTKTGGCTKPVNPTDPATGKEGRYIAPPE